MRVAPRSNAAFLLGVTLLLSACATSPDTDDSDDAGPLGDATASDAGSTDARTPFDASTADSPGADAPGGDDGGCSPGATRGCPTSCGTTGTESCAGGAWGSTCAPPAEICNLVDDDCNGLCDDVLGCRIGVDRSYDSTSGQHFYTTTDSEASCCGYSVEAYDAFYLYAAAQPGLVPLYRCSTATGHLYTTDAACDGATVEGAMGFIGTSASCGSVPLYGLSNATTGDHFYTTSAAEAASAASGGYTNEGTLGYVWPSVCGGTTCTWPSPIQMTGSMTTAATGFPSTWYGYPLPSGTESFTTLSGSVTVTNSANLEAEVLFILQYLPSGTCTVGMWPASTPEYGPPGGQPLGQFIVKAPTQGTFTVPIDLTLPGGLPMSSCVLLGLNGGPVSTSHAVTASASLSLSFTGPQAPAQSVLGMGGEFCFGQSWGCQAATTNDALSFANVTPVSQAMHLVALYGDISDSTFDGTSTFGAPPAGAWTATNDFYVYHGAECSSFGVASGTAGPGNYYAAIPADAVHLLSVPHTGSGIGVSEGQVYQALSNMPIAAGDCLVTLWGLQGGGGFDDETQIFALVAP